MKLLPKETGSLRIADASSNASAMRSELGTAACYQSEPRTSPPCGVQAKNQVFPLMPWATRRTLPSPMPTLIPPVCGETARHMHTLAAPPHDHEILVVLQKDGAGVNMGV